MTNSLVKFTSRKDGNGRGELFWGRAGVDGLPFRGQAAPSYRDEEFEERVVRVADPKNGTFYTGDEEQNTAYLKTMDGIANGWFHMVFIDRWRDEGDSEHRIYIEWVEYFLEDGSPVQHEKLLS
jgi:hypothetical protein|tara:strand:- start:47 stop:418 length:372 start_codon:yes stop_codon:yes gene_type:complete